MAFLPSRASLIAQIKDLASVHRTEVEQAFFKFLDCGDVRQGFARIRCKSCGETRLLAFSCKMKSLCPSCSVRRSLEFGEWLAREVVGAVPVRSITFTIPKMLRVYFKYDQSLYCGLARCAYETVKETYQVILDNDIFAPGMICGIHSFGNHANFHSHVHAIASQGGFDARGNFYRALYVPDEDKSPSGITDANSKHCYIPRTRVIF